MKRWQRAIQDNYGTPTIELVSGKGSVVRDADGKSYLDFLAGIATNVLGHAHPAIVKAVSKQISTLGHVSNFYAHPNVLELAEKLQKLTGDKSARVFFCNSGAEANEAALKLSRKTGKYRVVATQEAFHGRTMGALSLTGQPSKRNPFKPLIKGIKHVPFGDSSAMKRAITKKTAMVIVEPIMGEAGVVTPEDGYLVGLREICDRVGALLVFDCVQTGIGRTGQWFGYEKSGIKPDVITLAKGLGGGLPMGAVLVTGEAQHLFEPGQHGSTFGGNPVAAVVAMAALDVVTEENLSQNARKLGKIFREELNKYVQTSTIATLVRGKGLLNAIIVNDTPESSTAWDLCMKLAENGLLAKPTHGNIIRFAPPLVMTEEQLMECVAIIEKTVLNFQK